MTRKLIKVTQEYIDKGKLGSIQYCPIALAVKDQTDSNCSVFDDHLNIYSNFGRPGCYWLPTRARKFINRFDDRKPVKPFNFYLNEDDK